MKIRLSKYIKTPLLLLFLFMTLFSKGAYLLIPMDNTQQNHLKAYGIAYWVLKQDVEVSWLLNYRGGSFMFPYTQPFEEECSIRGVSFQVISDGQSAAILDEIADPQVNMENIKLHKAPRIAVYSPKNKQPWDDAVTLALTYSEIPYDVVYDEEIISGVLPMYDWLHLHHEDFTGQYGKFWASFKNYSWYIDDVKIQEDMAAKLGFSKVSQMKLAVAQKIRDFVAGGGYLFSMCSAPDSYDVALAAAGIDICDVMFDGDPPDPNAQQKLNYDNCFAFENFKLSTNPYEYEISSIDVTETRPRSLTPATDFFTLFDFSAKWDPVPTMLNQDHETIIKGFMGQTTAFNKKYVKSSVLILGENKSLNEARYIHGDFGNGTWTFLGGHDPEDYQHMVGDPPTDLNLYPNSPGYRLILNNVLFPAAKKQKRKT
ncbi:MAG TPA: asparagine synthetase B [Bacteroidales bacterium]|nr:asparagine synthetase B [Bacteroidales bacterium]HPS72756.1 asparagine synthetase B [Bacteroidales bacterium]